MTMSIYIFCAIMANIVLWGALIMTRLDRIERKLDER
jgi:hypothetical protein